MIFNLGRCLFCDRYVTDMDTPGDDELQIVHRKCAEEADDEGAIIRHAAEILDEFGKVELARQVLAAAEEFEKP